MPSVLGILGIPPTLENTTMRKDGVNPNDYHDSDDGDVQRTCDLLATVADLRIKAEALFTELKRIEAALARQPFIIQTEVGIDAIRAAIAKAEGAA